VSCIPSRRVDGDKVMTTANPNGRVFWAGLILILAALTATAQEFRGSLTGKITDPNGAVVPGSKVEIKNIETGIISSISSTQSIFGKYYHSFNPEDRQDWAGVVNDFPITQGFEYRTNDRGNIDYTNMLNSNWVFDIRASLNRFVQERRPAESFDPATAATSIISARKS